MCAALQNFHVFVKCNIPGIRDPVKGKFSERNERNGNENEVYAEDS